MNDADQTLSILFVEDHSLIARTISHFLEQRANVRVMAVADSAKTTLQFLSDHASDLPDLVLIDVSLPDTSGIDLVGILKEQYPDLPCLMLSGHREAHYIQRALEMGARGYVTKDSPQAIVEAVQHILQGEIYLSEDIRE